MTLKSGNVFVLHVMMLVQKYHHSPNSRINLLDTATILKAYWFDLQSFSLRVKINHILTNCLYNKKWEY